MSPKIQVKMRWDRFHLKSVYHGDREYILQAGNFNRHAIKVTNEKWFNMETFDYWGDRISSHKHLLIAFQKILFQGMAAALGPDGFCYALGLDENVKATEVRYDVFSGVATKLKRVMTKFVIDDGLLAGTTHELIKKMYNEGVKDLINLDGKKNGQ